MIEHIASSLEGKGDKLCFDKNEFLKVTRR